MKANVIESTFLAGKVLKSSLPVVQPPFGPDAPTLKRMPLPQGELAQFYDADGPIRYLAFIELRAGSVRGNHYHKIKEESLYVIQGQLLLVVEDLESKGRETVGLGAGDLVLIPAGIAHALRITESGQAVEFSPSRFDAADIHKFPVI